MTKQWITGMALVLLALGSALPAHADERPGGDSQQGFYGGVALRAGAAESAGLNFGPATSAWARFIPSGTDDSASRQTVFGGYRWSNDIAVEAAFNASDKYALRSPDAARVGGMGLAMAPGAVSLSDVHSRTWNVDVYTSWAFYRSFALYGRLGVGQSDAAPLFAAPGLSSTDPRRLRLDGVNYGVGLRYDMNSSLGLRVEYARFGRFATDALPDSDQVTFGVQFRF